MNSKKNWLLIALAAGLYLFIVLYERPRDRALTLEPLKQQFAWFAADKATLIEVHIPTNQIIRAEKSGQIWKITQPVQYAANTARINNLLSIFQGLKRQAHISAREMPDQKQALTVFGLEPAKASLVVQQGRHRLELKVGGPTPVGNQVYVQVMGIEGIFIAEANLLSRLPQSVDDWRDPAFLPVNSLSYNRLRLQQGPNEIELALDASQQQWKLVKPMESRANHRKLEVLFRDLRNWQILRFLPEKSKPDWESYGLQSPSLVVTFGLNTNDLLVVQFGASPTNETNTVYARTLPQNLAVQVPRAPFDTLRQSFSEFRETRLLSTSLSQVNMIEIKGRGQFVLRKQPDGNWWVTSPTPYLADPDLVKFFLGDLATLEIAEFVKDVVTDFSGYGFANPSRQYVLRTTLTNATTGITNRLAAQLDLGTNNMDKVYARVAGENSIYALRSDTLARLPSEAWQMYDRQLWYFTTNEVKSMTIKAGPDSVKLRRNSTAQWFLGTNSIPLGPPLTNILEESCYRLGQLRAESWVAQGDDKLTLYGIKEADHHLTMEVDIGGKPQVFTVDFGKQAPSRNIYAATLVATGQRLVFEFRWSLFQIYLEILKDLAAQRNPTGPSQGN